MDDLEKQLKEIQSKIDDVESKLSYCYGLPQRVFFQHLPTIKELEEDYSRLMGEESELLGIPEYHKKRRI